MFIIASDIFVTKYVPKGIHNIIIESIGMSKIAFMLFISLIIIPIAITEENRATKGEAMLILVTNSNNGIAIKASANPNTDLTNEDRKIIAEINIISVMFA